MSSVVHPTTDIPTTGSFAPQAVVRHACRHLRIGHFSALPAFPLALSRGAKITHRQLAKSAQTVLTKTARATQRLKPSLRTVSLGSSPLRNFGLRKFWRGVMRPPALIRLGGARGRVAAGHGRTLRRRALIYAPMPPAIIRPKIVFVILGRLKGGLLLPTAPAHAL